CEVFRGLGTEQPCQAGPDDITADQREYPAAKGDKVGPWVAAGPAGVAEPCRGQLPPRQVARGVGADRPSAPVACPPATPSRSCKVRRACPPSQCTSLVRPIRRLDCRPSRP